ncbi:MAG: tetratricopeptide repeat protein [Chlamydiota bacterium]|jgi:tetratricopeptide (TPR) repeat protein
MVSLIAEFTAQQSDTVHNNNAIALPTQVECKRELDQVFSLIADYTNISIPTQELYQNITFTIIEEIENQSLNSSLQIHDRVNKVFLRVFNSLGAHELATLKSELTRTDRSYLKDSLLNLIDTTQKKQSVSFERREETEEELFAKVQELSEQKCFNEALAIANVIADQRLKASILNHIFEQVQQYANQLIGSNRLTEAMEIAKLTLFDANHKACHAYGEYLFFETITSVVKAYIALGNLQEAESIANTIPPRALESRPIAFSSIVKGYINLGDLQKAESIADTMLSPVSCVLLLASIAESFIKRGNLEEALRVARKICYSDPRCPTFMNIAKGHTALGNLQEAKLILMEALETSRKEFGVASWMSYHDISDILAKIAEEYIKLGNLQEAISTKDNALEVLGLLNPRNRSRSESLKIIVEVCIKIAEGYAKLENEPDPRVESFLEEAIKLADEISFIDLHSTTYVSIAKRSITLGCPKAANEILELAKRTIEVVDDNLFKGKLLISIVEGFIQLKNFQKAAEILREVEREVNLYKPKSNFQKSEKTEILALVENTKNKFWSNI